jgi:formaldehyde-activating enzyme involved in methanogenesis|tara:strand:+ start:935 stop:1336 length:402 start_codon:yes stop_codon:yes gene_type:complete
MSNKENEIFEGKSFQDLTKDIYENSKNKKLQIDLLIQEIHGMITTIDDAVMVAPIIKEYMDVSVKNDEHLVKLAGVLQRIMAKSKGESDETSLLSDDEKADLMSTLQETVNDLQGESDRLDNVKKKTKGFMES